MHPLSTYLHYEYRGVQRQRKRCRTCHNTVRMLKDAKARASRSGLKFSLKLEDIIIPASCPILGVTLSWAEGTGIDCSPSLDRIIPRLGYVPGNVHVVSNRANVLKRDATLSELVALGAFAQGVLAT